MHWRRPLRCRASSAASGHRRSLPTGATFALLYVMSGNLAVPILAHSLYDCYTFYGTHLEVCKPRLAHYLDTA